MNWNDCVCCRQMCVRIWLEVGHACEPRRSALGRALALDWRLWVRGASGCDISAFVHKVVFHLHPASAFVYPKRGIPRAFATCSPPNTLKSDITYVPKCNSPLKDNKIGSPQPHAPISIGERSGRTN